MWQCLYVRDRKNSVCITNMARRCSTTSSPMTDSDLMAVVFHQLPPCERSFRYLTFIACVCKVWKECARTTRSSSTWLLPFRTRGISYHNALKNAKCDLNFDAFTSGMVEYFSSQKIQEAILELMFDPTTCTSYRLRSSCTRCRCFALESASKRGLSFA